MVHLIKQPATEQQLKEMLSIFETYIKVAVDIEEGILAGGGELHADCEAVLIEDGCQRQYIWGADWVPDTGEVRFGSLINIRGKLNKGMEIKDPEIQKQLDSIVRKLLQR